MKKSLLALAFFTAFGNAFSQTTLFSTGDSTGHPYRIPAIATAKNGDIIALSDYRPCGNDIGFGRVDILMRTSKDHGRTWSPVTTVLQGTGEGLSTGYGDACLVADANRNELALVCVAGNVTYWKATSQNPQPMLVTHASYDKKSKQWIWGKPVDITKQVNDTIFGGRNGGMFMGSGRICQSKRIKVGKYYRLYAALCTHKGNFVIYSDDFGYNWKALGDATISCAPKGDEPKCEELPDGNVVLSSRKDGGRYFNIFRYTNQKTATGAWGTAVDSREAKGGIANTGTPCNGEIMILPVRSSSGRKTMLVLQSIPAGPKRSNVTIYWKELDAPSDYDTPMHFAEDWQGSYQVSYLGSAYSTMTLQKDGRIGFFYEEEPQWYQMVYRPLTISQITQGKYTIR